MTSFAALAIEIRLAASREALGAEALELFAARADEATFTTTLKDVRATGARLGEAYELLKALVPHEQAVRSILAGGAP